MPLPSSSTISSRSCFRWRTRTRTVFAAACLSAFVRASCTIRKAARSTPVGAVWRPRRCRGRRASPVSRARSTSCGSWSSPGWGASGTRSPSARSTPRSRRISAIACRAVVSIPVRSAASRACSGPSRRRIACAWIATTLIECETTSCNSRAIRARSASTASRSRRSRSRSACAAPVRRPRPAAARDCAAPVRRPTVRRPGPPRRRRPRRFHRPVRTPRGAIPTGARPARAGLRRGKP